MEIKISKQEILNEVEKRSSLEGFIFPDRYDNVWVSADRGVLVDSYWVEGCLAVTQLFKRYISNDSVTHSLANYDKDEVLTVNAQMPARYNSLLDGSLITGAKMIIACVIIQKWLAVTSPELSAKYGEEANGYMDDVKQKLLYRKDPNNKTSVKNYNDTAVSSNESALSAVKSDTESIGKTESELTSSKSDTESMDKEEYISGTKYDDEELKQYWDCKCS